LFDKGPPLDGQEIVSAKALWFVFSASVLGQSLTARKPHWTSEVIKNLELFLEVNRIQRDLTSD